MFLIFFVLACSPTHDTAEEKINRVKTYCSLKKKKNPEFLEFVADTLLVWFGSREGDPSIRLKTNQSRGPWAAWDSVMRSRSTLDSIWYDNESNAVKVLFSESNDFYDLLGKSPSISEQSFWINDQNLIYESVIYWPEELNVPTDSFLIPFVKWAQVYDSLEISQLYGNEEIVPSKENAVRWKKLLRNYRAFRESIENEKD